MASSHKVKPAEAKAAPRTLGDWLDEAVRRYGRAKVALGQVATNAHDEALYLLLRALRLPLDSEPTVLSRKVTAAEAKTIETILHRRLVERIPAAYLMREAFLGEHRFYVDERVIIPRSYFLEIIPAIESLLPAGRSVRRAVDVCTGSGCLAILLAHQFPQAQVDAIDLSRDALDVAAINVKAHQLESRVKLHAGDVFDDVPAPEAGYDIIVSNPPYEPSAHVDNQAAEFKAEPRMAHDGGPDGLVIIRKLIKQARERIAPDGILLIEVGGIQKLINRTFPELQPVWLATEDGSNCVCLIRGDRLRAAVETR